MTKGNDDGNGNKYGSSVRRSNFRRLSRGSEIKDGKRVRLGQKVQTISIGGFCM